MWHMPTQTGSTGVATTGNFINSVHLEILRQFSMCNHTIDTQWFNKSGLHCHDLNILQQIWFYEKTHQKLTVNGFQFGYFFLRENVLHCRDHQRSWRKNKLPQMLKTVVNHCGFILIILFTLQFTETSVASLLQSQFSTAILSIALGLQNQCKLGLKGRYVCFCRINTYSTGIFHVVICEWYVLVNQDDSKSLIVIPCKLDMSTARRSRKSPQSLSGTSAHPTMVTLVNIMVLNGWLTSFLFHVNQPPHSWNKAISESDLETPKVKVMGVVKDQGHTVGPESY